MHAMTVQYNGHPVDLQLAADGHHVTQPTAEQIAAAKEEITRIKGSENWPSGANPEAIAFLERYLAAPNPTEEPKVVATAEPANSGKRVPVKK
jgi:hypothetical protein